MRHTLLIVSAVALGLVGCDEHAHDMEHDKGHDPHGDHDEAPAKEIVLTERAIERAGIVVEEVRAERLIGGIDVAAEVQLNPERTAHITPIVSGRIDEVAVTLGDQVEKGQVLARLRSVALGEARSMAANARAAVEVARANFQRQEERQREGIGSKRAYLEAQGDLRRAQADLAAASERLVVYGSRKGSGSTVTIRSPLDGTLIERHATVGEVVSDDNPLFVVADLSGVWVVGRVYEQDVAAAQVGAPAAVSLHAYPGRTWEGEISYVASTLDSHTRTLDIRVELDNPQRVLRPGLFGTISLSSDKQGGAPVVVIPEDAVQRHGERHLVFVPGSKPESFVPVFVTAGDPIRGKVEVYQGLEIGSRVVVSGAFTLKSEWLRGQLSEGDHQH